MESPKREPYINYSLLRVTGLIQALLGSAMLVLSGVILFALPSFLFWLCFFAGLYLFVPGVIITFSLVSKRAAQSWARFMLPLWRLFR
jgi:uncharacterized membrane protein HdeD (DUF308 family)